MIEATYNLQERNIPITEFPNQYLVVKTLANYIEIFKVRAETANTAVILAKSTHEPLLQYYSNEDQYGEGIFAFRILSESHEKFLYDELDAIFNAQGDLTLGESRVCH